MKHIFTWNNNYYPEVDTWQIFFSQKWINLSFIENKMFRKFASATSSLITPHHLGIPDDISD